MSTGTNTPNIPSAQASVIPTVTIQSELSALAHKQVTVTYSLIVVLVLLMGLMCTGGWFGLKAYEAQVSRAEVAEAKYDADRKDFLTTLAQHDAQRADDLKQESTLIAQIAARDAKPAPPVIVAALQPTASAKDAAAGLQEALPAVGTLEVTPDSKVAATVSQTQAIVTSVLSGNLAKADLVDAQKLSTLDGADISNLTTDLNSCKTNVVEANKVISDYKKIATKSKWRKFLDGAEKIGLVIAGAAIGHGI